MFEEHLAQLQTQHLLRRLRLTESAPGPVVTMEGRPIILMAANDYLGLATHPALKQAAVAAIERFGVGSGASRLISGTLPPHQDLETALARFKGTDDALVFGSGYLANIGLIPALVGTGDLILADRLCHASLIDGCRLSGATFRVFRHRDPAHLEQLLAKRTGRHTTLIVTDGVFSMDGDLAPLPDLLDLAERYAARLLVDDAHGTGVMGATGRGTLEHFGVESRLPFHMGTLSKALGGSGAYVAGPKPMLQYLVNHARSFIYTTAPPPATAAASLAALDVIRNEPERRTRLWTNRQWWIDGLLGLGYRIADTASPIVPVLIGEAEQALHLAERLLQLGVFAPAIRPPTVPEGTSRIRTTVSSEHRPEHLTQALAAFRQAGQELRLI
ncbi:MAG: 8-amino-7-oxononanoate synthase [Nitrospirota bacterium]|nr:8-amino-7-oxononanoate synthase [Nitrospirota bacterium]